MILRIKKVAIEKMYYLEIISNLLKSLRIVKTIHIPFTYLGNILPHLLRHSYSLCDILGK